MDRVVMPIQSSQHKNLGVETIEDIIDVEHEMGFGEGEDWSQDVTGYGKLSSWKTGPQTPNGYIRSQSNSQSNSPTRLRVKDKGTKRWLPQKPARIPKQVSSSSLYDERMPHVVRAVHHGDRPAEFPHYDNAEIIVSDMQNMREGGEDFQRTPQHHPLNYVRDAGVEAQQEEESPQDGKNGEDHDYRDPSPQHQVDHERRYGSPQANLGPISANDNAKDNTKDNRSRSRAPHSRGIFGSKLAITTQKFDEGNLQKTEPDLRLKKQQAGMRNPSRVRFSLDFETAEKLMGYKDATKGLEASTEENMGNKQDGKVGGSVENPVEKGSPVRPNSVVLQRKKEPSTRDARKDIGFDLEKVIEMKEDKKAIRLAQDRIERLEEALLRQQEIAANMRVALAQEGLKEYGKLRQLLDALEKNIRKLAISRSRHFAESYQLRNRADQVERLKAHCSMLEMDRERLKKKLENLLERTKEKEKELAALIVERDRLLEHKAKGSEECVKEWESKLKKVEASFVEEKAAWEEKLNACQSDWKDKKHDWAAKLKEKEAELCTLKKSQEKLIELLKLCRQGVDELKDVVQLPKGDPKGQTLSKNGDGGANEEIDALELARSIYSDTESLKMLLHQSPFLLQDARIGEHAAPLASLEEKSRVLDDKFSKTLQLTDRLKQDMERKEDELRQENTRYEQMVAEKARHVDVLERQLAEKELSVDTLVKELKNEVSLLSKELHYERRERSRLSDMHEDVQEKLVEGLEKRENEWEEIEVLKGKLDEMGAVVALKDGRIDSLEEEVKTKAEQLAHEKQKWDSAIKEVKQRAAKMILCFVNGKENGLLEQLLERRKARKAGEGQQMSPKADSVAEATVINKEASSLRDNTQSSKQSRPAETHSPRDWHDPNEAEEPELHKLKRKHDRLLRKKTDKFPAQADGMEEELLSARVFEWAGRNRGMDKKDVLDILEREKGSGNTTFALLQSTVQDVE